MLVGTSLGPYEILSLLGEGGMGQVYRARDKRLGRLVALKVLPEEMMQDRERLQRFAIEARAVSALNHPNIVAVYDVNLEPPIPYIVTELVDGESLRQLMVRGPLPVRKLYDIAVQVADGLAAAHQIGITHRDMKPENILLTSDERPKIADFGLAKQSAPPVAAPDGVTVTMNLTLDGAVMGTAGYMSPEQARGVDVDSRSDVFSFGLIVYEMASGLRAFRGATILEVLTATLRDDPAPIEADVPLPLKWTIQRCLAKEPRERYSSTRDLFQELKNQRDRLGERSGMWATRGFEAVPQPPVWEKRSLAAAGVLGLVVLGVLFAAVLRKPEGPDIAKYNLRPLATTGEFEDATAWSPDGSSIAYQSAVNRRNQIFTRSLQVSESVQVTRCESDCTNPLWSGDGSRLFFRQGYGVWSVGAAGGEPGLVMDNVEEFGLSRDGRTMAVLCKEKPGSGFSILLSSPPGAAGVKYLPAPYWGEEFANRPKLVFSPDGKKLLFAAWVGEADRGMEFWEFPLPPGRDKPRQVLRSLELRFPMRGVSWMPDSRHVVLAAAGVGEVFKTELHMADVEEDRVWPLLRGIGIDAFPAVSPDGNKVAYTAMEWDVDIVTIPLDGGPVKKMLSTRRMEQMPDWSPDGETYTYVSDRNGQVEIWLKASRKGWDRPLVSPKSFPDGEVRFLTAPVFAPDGDRVAFVRHGVGRGKTSLASLWIATVSGGAPVQLARMDGTQWLPTWSPDGSWIAFSFLGKKSGLMKVRVGGLAEPVMVREMTQRTIPSWSPAGDWIAFSTNADGLTLVSPDGNKSRQLDPRWHAALGWSRNGKILYGMCEAAGRQSLATYDIAAGTKSERLIEESVRIGASLRPVLRLSISPDGKSLATSASHSAGDLWLLENFYQKAGLLERLGLR